MTFPSFSAFFRPLLILATLLLLGAAPASAETLTLHVSPQGNDTWSGKLTAPSPAGNDGPLASLQGARDAIRRLPAPRPAINVIIAAGTYTLTAPLELTPEDSGRADAPIVYQGAPGARPLFTGGRALSGWTTEPDGTWSLQLPEVAAGRWMFEDLWVNDHIATRARTPNTGWSRIVKAAEEPLDATERPVKENERRRLKQGRQTLTLPPEFAAQLPSTEDAERYGAQIVVYHTWDVTRRFIASSDAKTDTVQTTGVGMKPWNRINRISRFYVESIPSAFDAPGEWLLSRDGLLRYRPLPGENPATASAVAPLSDRLLVLHGDPAAGRFVEHVKFSNLAFAHTRRLTPPAGFGPLQAATDLDAAIVADGVRQVEFADCSLRHIGGYALWLRRGCTDTTVTRCRIQDLGGGGIRIGEAAIPEAESARTGRITLDNNILSDGGLANAAAVGVWIGQSADNRVTHNDIFRFRYTGISVGWTWGYKPSAAINNLIAFNHLHHLGDDSMSDLGGIYTLGVSPGTVLRGNVIHDIERADYGGWGIYMDEGSSHILTEGNLVYHTRSGGFVQHYGKDNLVRNNIFALATDSQLDSVKIAPTVSFTFERNIVYWTKGDLFAHNWAKGNIPRSKNLYFQKPGKPLAKVFGDQTFADWQKSGQDPGSLYADPKLAAPEKGDFTLAPDSPAIIELGFVPIDASQAGVYGDAAWKAQAK